MFPRRVILPLGFTANGPPEAMKLPLLRVKLLPLIKVVVPRVLAEAV